MEGRRKEGIEEAIGCDTCGGESAAFCIVFLCVILYVWNWRFATQPRRGCVVHRMLRTCALCVQIQVSLAARHGRAARISSCAERPRIICSHLPRSLISRTRGTARSAEIAGAGHGRARTEPVCLATAFRAYSIAGELRARDGPAMPRMHPGGGGGYVAKQSDTVLRSVTGRCVWCVPV